MYIETKTRAIIKTISWRLLATFTTSFLVFIFVGRLDVAALVGGMEMICKLILYYFHERIWNRVQLGKNKIEPFVFWFTGLSGSGKTTLANKVYKYLLDKGFNIERLDGDTVRSIFPSTGYSKEERNTHIQRVGYLASILEKNGIIVIASFVSPYEESRNFVRNLCGNFIEIFVDASLEECEKKDLKGLYKKARTGEIKNFTGINDPYEKPNNPEITLNTDIEDEKESFNKIIDYIYSNFKDYKLLP